MIRQIASTRGQKYIFQPLAPGSLACNLHVVRRPNGTSIGPPAKSLGSVSSFETDYGKSSAGAN